MSRRASDLVRAIPWFMTQEGLEQVVAVADRDVVLDEATLERIEAIQGRRGAPYGQHGTRVRDGVAVIPVHGPMFRYANLFTAISGATSTEILAAEISAAVEDPAVQAIVLDVDSPGGEVNGLHEAAELIYSSRDRKPIVALGSGLMASAAYYLAAAAGRVVVSPSSVVGSIGTVLQVRNFAPRPGVEVLEFVSSQSPRKREDPFSEDDDERTRARASIQEVVDSLAEVFVQDVARFRGVDRDTVLSDFGAGGVLVGDAAVEAGLADQLGTLEGVLLSFTRPSAPGRLGMPAAGGTLTPGTETVMNDKTKPAAENPAAEAPATAPAPPAADGAAATAAAVAAERTRILEIGKLGGSPALTAELQADPSITVGQAAVRVLAEVRAAQEAAPAAGKPADLRDAHLAARAQTEAGNPAPSPSADRPTEKSEDVALGKSVAALVNAHTSRPSAAPN